MARRGIGLVFGGGGVGLMGVIADAVLEAGGHAIGVIPHALVARELAHSALPDLRVVNSMHDRKATMAALADAFVAMPGGFGTFEEFCEVITWTQLGVHRKSCGLLNVRGFYDPLIEQFDRGVGEGFIKRGNRAIVVAHVGFRGDLRYFRDLEDTEQTGGFTLAAGKFDFWRGTAGLTFRW